MFKFKVLFGQHKEGQKIYKAGEVVSTTNPLDEMFNGHFHKKFERLTGWETPKADPTIEEQQDEDLVITLQKMSIKELKEFAIEQEIDVGKAKSKPELVEVILNAVKE